MSGGSTPTEETPPTGSIKLGGPDVITGTFYLIPDVAGKPPYRSDHDGVLIYTDGACSNNGRPQARAGIGVFWPINSANNISERLPGRQTCNRAEIQAARRGIEQAKNLGHKFVVVKLDSLYVKRAAERYGKNKDWHKRPFPATVKNADDFRDLYTAMQDISHDFIKVPSKENLADSLAKAGCWKDVSTYNNTWFPPSMRRDTRPSGATKKSETKTEAASLNQPDRGTKPKSPAQLEASKSSGRVLKDSNSPKGQDASDKAKDASSGQPKSPKSPKAQDASSGKPKSPKAQEASAGKPKPSGQPGEVKSPKKPKDTSLI